MRCLTLAEELRSTGVDVSFICREHIGNLIDWIRSVKRFRVNSLPIDTHLVQAKSESLPDYSLWLGADPEVDAKQTKAILQHEEKGSEWLIVDHYALDENWESQMRICVERILVIDDLANRVHNCDLLLDQNLYSNMEQRYDGLVPAQCEKFLGPKYALLRKEFRRLDLKRQRNKVERIFVFFGGSDPTNETAKTLKALRLLKLSDIFVDVVAGSANPNRKQIAELCSVMANTNLYCQIENVAELMAKADLAIGAGGSTMWERCILGLPTIAVIIAENQAETTVAVAATGAILSLGKSSDVSVEILANSIDKVVNNPEMLIDMGKSANMLMRNNSFDGCSAIVQAILEERNESN